ncbi:CD209 antigen-like protein B [Biomphalaria pfeifferi]|uniref:CD209 antigen-like protein B n=1 Tax=Biomphalaria pfeifferi TaxID=112525 RepID=A0AAD8BZE5_BIOPF|nr:CD209 antigen-like protein B [Biomphalaria pfeifferi]
MKMLFVLPNSDSSSFSCRQQSMGYNSLTVGWFSNPLNYSEAGKSCACLNARLFVANETNRLNLLVSLPPD